MVTGPIPLYAIAEQQRIDDHRVELHFGHSCLDDQEKGGRNGFRLSNQKYGF